VITLHGAIQLHRVTLHERSAAYGDDGQVVEELRLEGELMGSATTAATWAQAQAVDRTLRELVRYGRQVGGLHLANDQQPADDGVYELLEGRARVALETPIDGRLGVALTLRRLGGGGAAGANLARRVAGVAAVAANSFSIVGAPWLAAPVGASFLPTAAVAGASRTGADGGFNLSNTADGARYALAGADHARGECKVWDTGGSANAADWARVYSPDHAFASPAHCVLDNGLVRFRPSAATAGRHEVDAWNTAAGAWTALTDANGDLVALTATLELTLDEVGPWRVAATWRASFGSTVIAKAITLERGKHTGRVDLAASAAVTWNIGQRHDALWRWLATRTTAAAAGAIDMATESATALSALTDNVVVLLTNTVNAVAVAAVAGTTPTVGRIAGGRGVAIGQTSTALTVHLGGVAYAVADAWAEAEGEALSGGADVVTGIAGYSGSGLVRLDALNEQVSFTSLLQVPSSAPGSRILALFRVAHTVAAGSANANDRLKLGIWNQTAGADAASVTLQATNATYFATANAWVWVGLEYASWNGTDQLYPYATKSQTATAAAFGVDQALFLTLNGGPGANRPRDVAHQALTDLRAWPVNAPAVR
jgi:hypothetical protein